MQISPVLTSQGPQPQDEKVKAKDYILSVSRFEEMLGHNSFGRCP